MKVRFEEISQYVHSYYIEGLHSNLKKFKKTLLKEFAKEDLSQPSEYYKKLFKEKPLRVSNIELNIQPLSSNIQQIFFYIIRKYFNIEGECSITKIGCYVQNEKEYQSFYHHHYLDSSIVGVTYIDPPIEKEGGGIEFNMANTNPTDPFIIYPKPDYFYLFPAWALHRPLPQTSTTPRISLNIGINTVYKPYHKLTNITW